MKGKGVELLLKETLSNIVVQLFSDEELEEQLQTADILGMQLCRKMQENMQRTRFSDVTSASHCRRNSRKQIVLSKSTRHLWSNILLRQKDM